jgi:signal transduction histidine kinase
MNPQMRSKLTPASRERQPAHTALAVTAAVAAATAVLLGVLLFAGIGSDWSPALVALALVGGAATLVALYAVVRRCHGDLARAAALSERRRIARELHDGLAQELVYIGMESERLARRSEEHAALDGLRHAAQRALDESRTLIGALTRAKDEPLHVALERTAEELSHRTGANVRVNLSSPVKLKPFARETLVRIMREGVTNAVRHANASEINVELSNGRDVRLRISDNGLGFDPGTETGAGFGISSMRERARLAGGDLRLVSQPGAGTEIEVVLP